MFNGTARHGAVYTFMYSRKRDFISAGVHAKLNEVVRESVRK
jgi:hypothetical protein